MTKDLAKSITIPLSQPQGRGCEKEMITKTIPINDSALNVQNLEFT